jgi:hypothetical protein
VAADRLVTDVNDCHLDEETKLHRVGADAFFVITGKSALGLTSAGNDLFDATLSRVLTLQERRSALWIGTGSFRVLFSTEGRFSQVLLSLSAFEKRTQKTPKRELELAESRLGDWRARGRARAPKP